MADCVRSGNDGIGMNEPTVGDAATRFCAAMPDEDAAIRVLDETFFAVWQPVLVHLRAGEHLKLAADIRGLVVAVYDAARADLVAPCESLRKYGRCQG